jgi:MinD superfamily P-loop ATPase
MKITVASGKGGTGKTTVAVNLLLAVAELADAPAPLTFLDCDVEAPNAHIFLKPALDEEQQVGLKVPEVDMDRCTLCGTCAEVCAFNAVAVIGSQVLVFPELCHGCGSCTYNCPEAAIREVLRPTGRLEWGTVAGTETSVRFGRGVMNVGEAMATPIIRKLKAQGIAEGDDALTILDAPPGNACPVVETMRGSDVVVLVTEPTPFGLHDLRVAVDVAREELNLPIGVVINREGVGDAGVETFCAQADVPVLMRIPLDRRIAEAYADGVPMVEALPAYRAQFAALYARILELTAA